MKPRRPRIGLIAEGRRAARHVRLMESSCEWVPLWLVESGDEREWSGVTSRREVAGVKGWTVTASLMRADRLVLRGQVPRRDVQWQSWADALVDLARRESLDAFHVLGWHAQAPAVSLAAGLADLPLVMAFEGDDLEAAFFTDVSQMRAVVGSASACACRNPAQRRLLQRVLSPACAVTVVPHHVQPVPVPGAALPGLALPSPLVGCVARLDAGMGLELLIEAFDLLVDERPCWLLLAGPVESGDASWLAACLARARHGERIVSLGGGDGHHLAELRQACDVLVVPIVAEGHEEDLLEALRDRSAVVGSGFAILAGLGVDAGMAREVPPRDPPALARALADWLMRSSLREKRAEEARRGLLERFAPEGEINAWIECYRNAGLEC